MKRFSVSQPLHFAIVCAVVFSGWALPASAADSWASHLQGSTAIRIEFPALSTSAASKALPDDVAALLGPDTVEYESFVVTHPPPNATEELKEALAAHDLGFAELESDEIHLPHRSFEPSATTGRERGEVASAVHPSPVSGLSLIHFAYPIKAEWIETLAGCGLEKIVYFPEQSLLVRGEARRAGACGLASFVDWTGPYFTTDRVAAKDLSDEGERAYWLEFLPGTDLEDRVATLPDGATAGEKHPNGPAGMPLLQIRATPAALAEIVSADPDLLTVTRSNPGVPSDERQGAIVAGFHNDTSLTTSGWSGYRSWLTGRGLLSSSNQQEVGVIDIGYDDGSFNLSNPSVEEHHIDLERPERLADLWSSFSKEDTTGHGTMVSGILVGDGSQGTGAQDTRGYHLGTGIAPAAKLVFVKTIVGTMSRQETAIEHIRNSSTSAVRGHIINESWNESASGSTFAPVTDYDAMAQFFDARTIDANDNTGFSGDQPSLFVYSAGNFANNCNNLTWNTVSSPALAKNVLAVGATRSYRPNPSSSATSENADHVSRVANFSGRGKQFAAYPSSSTSNNTRIKPDVVAPAVRVYSTVPYDFADYDDNTDQEVVGCTKYYPPSGASGFAYHTYGSGTSFAAPVASGAAALCSTRSGEPTRATPTSTASAPARATP